MTCVWILVCTLFICIIEDEIWFFDSYWVTFEEENNGRHYNDSDEFDLTVDNEHVVSKIKANSWFLGSWFVPKIYGKFSREIKSGKVSYQEKYEQMLDNLSLVFLIVHLCFGVAFVGLNILFIRNNEMFTLDMIMYAISFVLGAIALLYILLRQRFRKLHKLPLLKQSALKERIKTRYGLQATQVFSQFLVLLLGIAGTRMLYALLGGLDFGNIFVLPMKIIIATFLCWFLLFYRTLEVLECNIS